MPAEKEEDLIVTPWGKSEVIYKGGTLGAMHKVKKLTVNPGQRMSLHSHNNRTEHFVVVAGCAILEAGNPQPNDEGYCQLVRMQVGNGAMIAAGQRHRIGCWGPTPLVIIETQLGRDMPREEDITRYEDDYGRMAGRR